jgi:hypothetical protein
MSSYLTYHIVTETGSLLAVRASGKCAVTNTIHLKVVVDGIFVRWNHEKFYTGVGVGFRSGIISEFTPPAAFVPNINFESNFIYSANSSCIDTVICDGNILMEGRKVAGEEQILEKADEMAWKLINVK